GAPLDAARARSSPNAVRPWRGPMRSLVAFALVGSALVLACSRREPAPAPPAASPAPATPVAATPPPPAGSQSLHAHEKTVTAVAFAADGKSLLTASEDGTVALWDIASRKLEQRRSESGGEVTAIALAPAGTPLAIAVVGANGEGYVEVVDLAGNQLAAPRGKLEAKNVHALAWSPDGSTLAIGNVSAAVTLWQPAGGATRTLSGQEIEARALA